MHNNQPGIIPGRNNQLQVLQQHKGSVQNLKGAMPTRKAYGGQAQGGIGQIQHRHLSLKQLKDTIQDMYSQKIKFDKKCEDSKQPRETMEQYMYTYLNQKYGLKSLIIEWAVAIANGVRTHFQEDHDVTLFGKILKNQCDEEFRFIQMHVKDTLFNLMKVLIKDRFPFKMEVDVAKMLDSVQADVIEEWMWRKIIDKMYDPLDSQVLEERLYLQIEKREEIAAVACHCLSQGVHHHTVSDRVTDQQIQQFFAHNKVTQVQAKKMTRDQIDVLSKKQQGKLLYYDFQKIILDFQLQEHEKFLMKFTELFKRIDVSSHGVLNEDQFRLLIREMGLVEDQQEVEYLVGKIDPYNNNKMTYSEVVQLLSSHLVLENTDDLNSNSIPVLEKFSNLSENGVAPPSNEPSHDQSDTQVHTPMDDKSLS